VSKIDICELGDQFMNGEFVVQSLLDDDIGFQNNLFND